MQSATKAYNLPIQFNINNYSSLTPYQKKVKVNGSSSCHMTVVFTQMANKMVHQKAMSILNNIQNSSTCQYAESNIDFQFKEFKLLGSNLVVVYEPIAKGGAASLHSQKTYKKFVNECRRMVRRAADQMAGKGNSVQRNTFNQQEIGTVNGKSIYKMDVRPPIPHITIKRNATQNDLNKVNALLKKKNPPHNLQIRLNTLTADKTKEVRI